MACADKLLSRMPNMIWDRAASCLGRAEQRLCIATALKQPKVLIFEMTPPAR